jgi:hypothetical protein
MTTTITAAGFIVADDSAIWGVGATADKAWADMLDGMTSAHIRVLDDGEEADDGEAATDADSFHTLPATAALLAEVESKGGNIAWGTINRVACTVGEEDAANA